MRIRTPHRITLVKPDGTIHEEIPADVHSDLIIVLDVSVPVEDGDRIRHVLPNGLIDSYVVMDRGFMAARGSFKDHYQIKVRKENRPPDSNQLANSNRPPDSDRPLSVVYNLHGANSRINIQSSDSSFNVVNASTDKVFDELRSALQSLANTAERDRLLNALEVLEANQGKPTFTEAYQQFISGAASHMTLISPFIPALTQMLAQ
jgi:hypothetical protein